MTIRLPVLHSMSEIAGPLSIQLAERFLESYSEGGRGILLGGITGVAPAAVVILGAGVVGLLLQELLLEEVLKLL